MNEWTYHEILLPKVAYSVTVNSHTGAPESIRFGGLRALGCTISSNRNSFLAINHSFVHKLVKCCIGVQWRNHGICCLNSFKTTACRHFHWLQNCWKTVSGLEYNLGNQETEEQYSCWTAHANCLLRRNLWKISSGLSNYVIIIDTMT